MAGDDNVAVVVRALQAFGSGDSDALLKILSPDVVWHIGGRNPMSGVHHGPAAVIATTDRVRALFDETKVVPHDILSSDRHVVVLADVQITRRARPYAGHLGYIFHVSEGVITDGWVIQEDQARWDEMCAWE